VLAVDMWLSAAIVSVGAVARLRGFGWSGAVSAAGAIAATVRPDLATPIFITTAVVVGTTTLCFAYRLIK
jgi:hypothetical protein